MKHLLRLGAGSIVILTITLLLKLPTIVLSNILALILIYFIGLAVEYILYSLLD